MLYSLFIVSSLLSLSSALALNITERSDMMKRKIPPAPVYYDCVETNVIALTFNNGPSNWTEKIVKTLNQYNAKGTFFVDGVNNGQCIYDKTNVKRLEKAYKDGHQIASHGWENIDYGSLSRSRVGEQLDKIDTALEKILGIKPAFFRPPQEAYSRPILEAAGRNHQGVVYWDLDSGDAQGYSPADSEARYRGLVTYKYPSALAQNDETVSTTATEVLPWVLRNLGAAGYKFVTVAECLGGLKPYLSERRPTDRDSSWKC